MHGESRGTDTYVDDYRVNRDLTGTIATLPRFRTLESAMRAPFFRHFFIGFIGAAAALQWTVVLERTWAAVWAWYKFAGYGDGGHIVVTPFVQVVFLVGSCVLVCIGYALYRAEARAAGAGVWEKLARLAWSSIAVCTLFWFFLLLTPLVAFTRT